MEDDVGAPPLRLVNFISEDQLDHAKKSRGLRVEDGTAQRDRPLYEILKENKDKKDAEFNERFKHRPPKALDEDETEFLDNLEMTRREYERQIADEEAVELRSFQVLGFVTKMEECMGACDCIITKAGPGTIAEAMIRGLPIILNDYIAGQEAGNVPYVVENGCGKFSKSPKAIAKIVADWFGPKVDELSTMSQNARKLARPDAVFKIVHDLDELALDVGRSASTHEVLHSSCSANVQMEDELNVKK